MTTSSPAYPASGGDNDSLSASPVKSDAELLQHIRRRFDYMTFAWREVREAGEADMQALTPEGPWDRTDRAERKKAGRPCIHLDQLTQYTNGFMGEVRQSPIAGKVEPGTGGTPKTAELRQERIRAIEYESKATQATLTALENATERSYGAFGIGIDYKSWDSDDLEIKYRRFANPDAVLWDPDCKEADWSDMKDGFFFDWMTFDDFKAQFGEEANVTTVFGSEHVAIAPNWINMDRQMVQVAEYYRIEYESTTTKGGRKTRKPTLWQYFTNGIQILDRVELPVPEVPIFPITGKERFIKDGNSVKRVLYSYIRLAVDAQMLFDYYKTNEAEDVGLAPKPKYAGYKGQFGDGEEYKNINKSSDAYVEFEMVADPVNGSVLPLPRWDAYTPNIEAMEVGSESARRAIQAALGTYGFTRLDDTNVKSGKAVKELKSQGQLPSYHLIDNYKMSVQRATRYVNRLLGPVEGDQPIERPIRKADGTQKVVKINQPSVDDEGKEQFLRYDETPGAEHTVTITDGPSYQSQRDEATTFADTLAQSDQPWVPLIMDLVVKLKNLGPIGDQIAERLTPPQFKKPGEGGPDPQQLQQQLQQVSQQHDQLVQALNDANQKLESKQVEMDAKKQIQAYSDDVKLAIALESSKNKVAADQLSAFMVKMDHTLQMIMQEREHTHEAAMAAGQSAADQQQQEAAAEQQQAAAEQAAQHEQESGAASPA
jgi:hypothetical protein